MNRTVTAAIILGTCLFLADCASAQPALKKLEDLIRRQREGTQAEAVPDEPEKVAPGAARQIQEPGREHPPEGDLLERGYLGAVLDDQKDRGRGVRVLEVLPDGPADKAGLRADDLITGLGGVRVRQMSDMADVVGEVPVGGIITFEILRGDRRQEVQVTLGRRPPPEERRFKTLLRRLAVPREPAIEGPPEDSEVRPGELPAPPQGLTPRIEMLEERVEELEQRVEWLQLALEAARASRWGAVRPATRPLPVTATVTFNGQPVEGARVLLVPVAADSGAAFGLTDAAGKARLATFEPGDGAIPGGYRVTISKTNFLHTGPEGEHVDLLPPRYASPETSVLAAEVVAGGVNDFAFDLRD